ncbi:MAG: SctK family type III secretion system sorting platform protein [Pseudomonadota bacterium]
MSDPDLKRLIKCHDPLLPLIYEFNFWPGRYIHPSWLEGLIENDLFNRLKESRRAGQRLSPVILLKFGLDRSCFFNFEDPLRRLALLNGEALLKLVYLAGVSVHAGEISRVIEREAVLSLKKSLGEEPYLFALKRAPFLAGRIEFPPYPLKTTDYAGFGDLVYESGMKVLEACLGEEEASYRKRLVLKLPRALVKDFGERASFEHKEAASLMLKKILLNEVDPEWGPFFT